MIPKSRYRCEWCSAVLCRDPGCAATHRPQCPEATEDWHEDAYADYNRIEEEDEPMTARLARFDGRESLKINSPPPRSWTDASLKPE